MEAASSRRQPWPCREGRRSFPTSASRPYVWGGKGSLVSALPSPTDCLLPASTILPPTSLLGSLLNCRTHG